MQCQCIRHWGQPLVHETRADMDPQGTEVILEVVAAGVCHTDLNMRTGSVDLGRGQKLDYGARGIGLPLTLGHETVGRVVATGPDVGDIDTSKTYVIFPWCGCGECDVCKAGEENLCSTPKFLGIHTDGGYATQIRIAHPRYLFDIGSLTPAQAAPLACSGLTTYSALKKLGDAPKTQPALLIGAGGLGLQCVQLMSALDMLPPVVVDIDPAKRAAALAAGARAAFDPADPEVLASITKAGDGAPVSVIDFVGAEPTAKLGFDALGKGGTLITVGLFGGATPWSLPMITLKSARIIGVYVGSLNDFADLMSLARNGAIKPIPTTPFPLLDADSVLDRLHNGGIVGRAVLVTDTA